MANKAIRTQKEVIIIMILSLILGGAGGFAIGTSTDSIDESPKKTVEQTMEHVSSTYDVPAEQAPKVVLEVTEDAKSGYNIKLTTENFTFTPESINGSNVMSEGHAHLYVDDEKISRLYGPNFHYDESFEGTKTFKVTLNANDHSEYAVNGEVISASVDITHDENTDDHDASHAGNTPHDLDEMEMTGSPHTENN